MPLIQRVDPPMSVWTNVHNALVSIFRSGRPSGFEPLCTSVDVGFTRRPHLPLSDRLRAVTCASQRRVHPFRCQSPGAAPAVAYPAMAFVDDWDPLITRHPL